MSSTAVNVLIGRLLSSPSFLSDFSAKRDLVASLPHFSTAEKDDIVNLDLTVLSDFAALIVKVQNNFLWEVIPHTRRLMRTLGLDSDVFGQFSSVHDQLKKARVTRNLRVESFLQFLGRYLESNHRKSPPLQAVFSHEQTLHAICNALATTASQPLRKKKLRPESRIVPIGHLFIKSFTCDPLLLVSSWYDVAEQVEATPCVETSVVYWRAIGEARPRIFRVPPAFGNLLNSLVTTGNTVRSFCESSSDIDLGDALVSLASLQHMGMISATLSGI